MKIRLFSTILPCALGAGLICALPTAKAIAPMGDNAELFVTGVASVSDNSNLFLSHTGAKSVGIFDLTPGLSYEFGNKNSLLTGQFAYTEDFQFFSQYGSNLNYQLAHVLFWTKYDDGANKFNADASFQQADQAEVGIQNLGTLINRDLYHVDGTDEVSLTEKTSVSAGAAYDDTHYRQSGYDDYSYTEVPVNAYFKVEPKLDFSVGFRYRDNSVGGNGINSEDYFYNVGARGEFTPNITGQFNVGYQEETLDNGKKVDGLGANSKFTYAIDPKVSMVVGFNDDFSYAALGDAIRSVGPTLGFTALVSEGFSLNAQLAYNDYSYITTQQRDNFYSAGVSATYAISKEVSFTAGYTYSKDDSNITLDSFNDSIFSFSGSLRF